MELNDTIQITENGRNCIINYDLSGSPTFWIEWVITDTTTYGEYQRMLELLAGTPIGFLMVANISGVSFKDSTVYIGNEIERINALDRSATVDFSFALSRVNATTFNAIDYAKGIFDNGPVDCSDNGANGFNFYSWEIKKKSSTDTTYVIASKLVMDMSKDYTKLMGLSGGLTNPNTNTTYNDNNNVVNTTINTININSNVTTNTNNTTTELPKTGANNILCISIFILSVLAIILSVKAVKYKDI